jgi:hypothetical protein
VVGGWEKTREQTLLVLSPREAVGFEEEEDCEPLANTECPGSSSFFFKDFIASCNENNSKVVEP